MTGDFMSVNLETGQAYRIGVGIQLTTRSIYAV